MYSFAFVILSSRIKMSDLTEMYSLKLLIFEGEYLRSVLSNFLFSNNLFN